MTKKYVESNQENTPSHTICFSFNTQSKRVVSKQTLILLVKTDFFSNKTIKLFDTVSPPAILGITINYICFQGKTINYV